MSKNPSNRFAPKAATRKRPRGNRTPSPRAPRQDPPKTSPPRRVAGRWVVAALAAIGLAYGGWLGWHARQAEAGFEALVAQGAAALGRVEIGADAGRAHSSLGQDLRYVSSPPTSGTHWPDWVDAGFYTAPQPEEKLVHSLEHGNVVVYYDRPGEGALQALQGWAARFRGAWDGLVVTPVAGLGPGVILTAWNKTLRLERWDPSAAAAFVDTYRGRGPENPVR
ncbi:hypothetical protein Mlute_01776 [Meiothermus luteus]|uniref:DUF3105 domain-containing protein n=3 Tax=Thermaceae TaxID=188786 RepID=A0A399EYI1_9DEIN|nr:MULTISPECIES: DUF3105 domain-containing protein [Calidithermus]RIH84791.1 hypothetical protein Mlute_01776 [Meiothermus luteus]RIH88655.1 hypothetical protein Mterra_00959 [Calidithermus terrae]GIW32639.1 MAG: hypothetical protein KatS3mg071_2813 [Meiothermus sp.]